MTPSHSGASGRHQAQRPIAWLQATLRRHRLLRFLLVGGLNTLVGYGMLLVALAVLPSTLLAVTVSMALAMVFNFVSTGMYVFGSADPRRLWRFLAVYGVVYAYNAPGVLLLERAGIAPAVGALLLLPGAVAISYLLNRSFTFRERP